MTVEYHWLEGQYDRLPALVADLVRRHVAVIATPASTWLRACGQSCNSDDPDRLRCRRRPGPAWSCRQPRPARRQRDRHQFFHHGGDGQGAAAAARPGAQGRSYCRARQSGQCCDRRAHVAGRAGSRPRHRAANPDPQRHDESARSMRPLPVLRASAPMPSWSAADSFFTSRLVQFVTLTAVNRIPAAYCDSRFCRGRRADELRHRPRGRVSSSRRLHRPGSQGREARRPAGAAIDQIRVRASTCKRRARSASRCRRRCSRSPTR